MPANNIVFIMNGSKPQVEGNVTLCSPGGKAAINVAEVEKANTLTPGITHYPGRPTAIQTRGADFIPASGANANWGGSGPVQIAAFPTYYQGNNNPSGVSATPIG